MKRTKTRERFLLLGAAVLVACGRQAAPAAEPKGIAPSGLAEAGLVTLDPKLLLPILRSFEPSDVFAQAGVYRQFAPGVGAFLAQVSAGAGGATTLDYVIVKQTDWSQMTQEAAFSAAWDNLKRGLKVSARQEGTVSFFAVEHPSGLPAAAIGLSDFYLQSSGWIEAPEVFVAIPDSATLLVARAGSPAATKLQASVAQWDGSAGPSYLVPACYLLSKAGLRTITPKKGGD